jgi:hypothetical protein
MDPWWVQNVILHPRKKDGGLMLSAKVRDTECANMEEYFRKKLEQYGFPEVRIRMMWQEYLKATAAKPVPVIEVT